MRKELEYPYTEGKVRALRVGDIVSVSGRIYTGRDRFHKYLAEGGESPVVLEDGAIYHCGPVVLQRDGAWQVRAAGPTTSMREEPHMPGIMARHGVRLVIGKGGMGEGTRRACMEHGAAYLQAVGGAACVLAACIEDVLGVHFLREFGSTEAVWDLRVRGLTCAVTMDADGRSLHKRVRAASRRALKSLLG